MKYKNKTSLAVKELRKQLACIALMWGIEQIAPGAMTDADDDMANTVLGLVQEKCTSEEVELWARQSIADCRKALL